jgi:hypothetical protein
MYACMYLCMSVSVYGCTHKYMYVQYPAFLAILLFAENIGGMETAGKIRQIEITENNLLY